LRADLGNIIALFSQAQKTLLRYKGHSLSSMETLDEDLGLNTEEKILVNKVDTSNVTRISLNY